MARKEKPYKPEYRNIAFFCKCNDQYCKRKAGKNAGLLRFEDSWWFFNFRSLPCSAHLMHHLFSCVAGFALVYQTYRKT